MEPPNTALPYPDPFLESDDLPAFSTPNQPPLPRNSQLFSSQPTFKSPSLTPSPANLNFNPDDFLASPPQPSTIAGHTLTPELKRRLFPTTDPLSSAPSTTRKTALATTLFTLPSEEPSPPTLSPSKPVPVLPPLPKRSQKTKCNCKASRCLKLYCPCFAASGFCAETCTCKNCQNSRGTPHAVREARETVLARDPRAFEPKVRNSATTLKDNIHTKGCNCRKGCGKNYCVCRELRVACGPRCTCSGPKGCLNGKIDTLVDGHIHGNAEEHVGIAKVGPSPRRFLTGLPPLKFSRMKQGVKQKREKRIDAPSPSPKMEPLLSPSFPGINIDASPTVDLHDNLEDFRQVMSDDGFMTPFTLRKAPFRPIEDLTTDKSGKRLLSSVLQGQSGVDIAPLSVKRRISLEVLDEPKQEGGLSEDARHKPQSKRIRMHADLIDVNEKTAAAAPANGDDNKTPDQTDRLPDIKFAMSPTTGAKDGLTRTLGQPLFGRQDKIEVCRLPRILRVKMGSGKPLRKFDL